SPATNHHRWPDTLLGYPSLQRLLDDLRNFLLRKGLAPRLQSLASELRQLWSDKLADLERREGDLTARPDSLLREIREAMKGLEIQGAIRKALYRRIDHSLDQILRPVQDLQRGLSALQDRGDFERIQEAGSSLMTEYNVRRQSL